MIDWQGNNIQVGDTILHVRFKSLFGGCRMGLMMITPEGLQPIGEPVQTERDFQWVVTKEITVTNPDNKFTLDGDAIPINLIDPFALPNQMNECLCIKGKSDNREAFMEHYLNQ